MFFGGLNDCKGNNKAHANIMKFGLSLICITSQMVSSSSARELRDELKLKLDSSEA